MKKIKSTIAKTLLGSMLLSAATTMPAFASVEDTNDFEQNGFQFTFVGDEAKENYIARTWLLSGYDGNEKDVVIPKLKDDFYGPNGEYVVNFIHIEDDIFNGNESIDSLTIENNITKFTGDSFSTIKNLKEFKVGDKVSGMDAEDGLLYSGDNVILPKGKKGSISVRDGISNFAETYPLYKMNIDTLTLPETMVIDNEYTLIGANVKRYEGAAEGMKTVDGSLFSEDGSRLIAYGNDSSADLSQITEVNPYAFSTQEELRNSNLPESLKKSVPFSFTVGEAELLDTATRYFTINGKTAYCYNHGRLNPIHVGEMTEYNNKISDQKLIDKITRLLCAGVPNDGVGMFEDIFGEEYDELRYGLDGDAAKNVVGSLVWEYTDDYLFDADDIYGVENDVFEKEKVSAYIDALRSFAETGVYNGKDYNVDIENNFKLGFYEPESDEYQGLVVLSEKYTPEPDVEPEPEPTPDPEPEKPATPSEPEKPATPSEPDKPSRPGKPSGPNGSYSGWDGPDPVRTVPDKTEDVPVMQPEEPVPTQPIEEPVPSTPRQETTVPKTGDYMWLIYTLATIPCLSIFVLEKKKKISK